MQILSVVLIAVGVVVWLLAAVSWIRAVSHRKSEVPLSALVLSGMKAFDPDNFTAEGQRHQRRFMIAFAMFFVVVFLGVAVTIAASTVQ